MKITFFIGSLIGGGAEHVTCNMANYLVSSGYDVSILTMSETESYYLDSRVSTTSLLNRSESGNAFKSLLIRTKRLKSFMKSNDCDAYIVMLPITIILLLAFKRYTSAPIIASERSSPSRNPKWIQYLLKKMAHRASGWVFQTPEVLEWYNPYIVTASAVIIPNAIDNELPVREDSNKLERKVVSVGRLHASKRFDNLIRAFSMILPSFPEYELVIYGEGGNREELENLIEGLSLNDKVKLPGFRTDVNKEIANASLFVMSSDYEGMPNTLIEAMAMGLPCVATDCDGGAARFLVKDGVNGLLVQKSNIEQLAHAMSVILSDPEKAKSLGDEAKKIRERLSPDDVYQKWLSFINKVIKTKP